MKTTKKIMTVLGVTSIAVLPLVAGPTINVQVGVPAPPPVIVPAPAVTVEVGVPDYYVWDGVEFVGMVGAQYYYLGPGNVWMVCDRDRLGRFHDWERGHADWRAHATANVRYRSDAGGHFHGEKSHDHGDHGH